MKFKVTRMGEAVEGVYITGEPRNCEPESFRVVFPFGHLEVTRATDGPGAHYWVHVYVNNPHNKSYCEETDGTLGEVRDARLDQTDRHSFHSKLGDFNRPQLYHLALRVGPRSGTIKPTTKGAK